MLGAVFPLPPLTATANDWAPRQPATPRHLCTHQPRLPAQTFPRDGRYDAMNASEIARRTFDAENNIRTTSKEDDALYYCDTDAQSNLRLQKPWASDVHYFQDVHISAVALIKMAMHARSGGNIEVMGSIQGKIVGRSFVVLDVFPLPVQGTETRINAGQDANEFLVQYSTKCGDVGRHETIIGWYHSHPGYGCWLSGIDVSTQSTHQMYEDPFLAIVIDPIRTISSGKIDIGAFRTYPAQYINANNQASSSTGGGGGSNNIEYQNIPINKIEDFGVHCKSYYQLNIHYFKSNLDVRLLDLLWNKYWARSLSTSPLIQNREYVTQQLNDLGRKINQIEEMQLDGHHQFHGGNRFGKAAFAKSQLGRMNPDLSSKSGKGIGDKSSNGNSGTTGGGSSSSVNDTHLDQISKDAQKCCGEHMHSVMSMYIKNALFGKSPAVAPSTSGTGSRSGAGSTAKRVIPSCRPDISDE